MNALRLALAALIAVCLVLTVARAQHDGATLLGILALAGFLATYGVFSRTFWTRDAVFEDVGWLSADGNTDSASGRD